MRRILFLAALTSVSAASARAQAPVVTAAPIEVSNRSAGGLPGESGKTVTAVFSVKNPGTSAVRVIPEITMPEGWRVVLGSSSFVVGPADFEIWTVGFLIPAQAKAGRYSVPVLARTEAGVSFTDSVIVTVGERYQLEAAVAERASHVIAGEEYSTRFVVRNRGNTDATIHLRAASSGVSRIAGDSVIAVPAAGATTVTVVSRVAKEQINGSDVTELTLSHAGSATKTSASAMVPVIEPAANWLAGARTISGAVRLRAATGQQGVSPIEVMAGGPLGRDYLELLLRAPAQRDALLGERDEYRLAWRNETRSITLGDQYTEMSPLTSGTGEAFGASAAVARGALNVGGYSLRARRPGVRGAEHGATAGLTHGASTVALNFVSRTGAIDGQVASLGATVPFAGEGKLEMEYALGRDSAAHAAAHRLRLTGRVARARYEFATQAADREFAGPQRGGSYGYGSVSVPIGNLSARVYANQYGNEATAASISGISSRTTARGVAVESPFGVSLDVFHASRVHGVGEKRNRAEQDAARLFLARSAGPVTLLSSVTVGRNTNPTPSGATFFREYSISPQLNFKGQSVGASYSFSDGQSVHGNGTPLTNVGLNANLSLPRGTTLHFSGSGWRPAVTHNQWGVLWQARLGHRLPNGATVTLAAHATGFLRGSVARGATTNTTYLEYSTPLRLPVGRSRSPGQARGQVVDQRGSPVAGALVWVGERASLTNESGSVYFAGLRPGSHALVVGSRSAAASAATGRAVLHVDSAGKQAATFKIAVGQAGSLRVKVSNFAADPTVLDASAMRAGDAVPLAGLVVMLTSQRDTLYQTTDDNGYADFGRVDEGAWSMTVLGEVPPFTRWEKSRIDVAIGAGAPIEAEFRLIRVERRVRPVSTPGGNEQPAAATLRLPGATSSGTNRP